MRAFTLVSISFVALTGSALFSGSSAAQEVRATITHAGVYQLGKVWWLDDPSQPGGRRGIVAEAPTLIKSTDLIPLQVGVSFGLELFVEAPTETVNVRRVVRFPAPGLQDPDTGKRYASVETTAPQPSGKRLSFGFAYDQAWKLIPGEWSFEFWIDGKKVAEQKFVMVEPAGEASTVSAGR